MLNVSEVGAADESAPMSIGELRAAFRRVVGVEAPVEELSTPGMMRRTVGGNTRLAERFRAGRVLLVGDAAHVHSAIGGPGLNLGLQDTVNLGWKLAATIKGWAPDGLLDTYESERRPAGVRVNMQTQAQAVLIGPGPEVTALRSLVGELLTEPVVLRRIAGLISGADVRYDVGSASPLAGYLSPGLGPAQRDGRAVMVDTTGTLGTTVSPWRDRVDVVDVPVPGATAMLVRPDGYVAWASDEASPSSPSLTTSLTRWFGDPAL
jgi:hypothetical protein